MIEMGLHGESANMNTFTLIRDLVALKRNEFKNRGNSYFEVARRLDIDNTCTVLVVYILQQIAFIDKVLHRFRQSCNDLLHSCDDLHTSKL